MSADWSNFINSLWIINDIAGITSVKQVFGNQLSLI